MMVGVLILTLAVAPALAVIGCVASRRLRVAEALNLIASAVSFASAMPLPFLIDGQQLLFWNDYIIMDRMSAWVILLHIDRLFPRLDLCGRVHAASERG
jgi:hydrogenase-4 component F